MPPRQDSPYATTQQLRPSTPYQGPAQPPAYNNVAAAQPYQPRQTIQQVQAQQAAQYQQQQMQQPAQHYSQFSTATPNERYHEAYVLSDAANATIPKDIRDRFPQDDEGRILFFTRPPLDTRRMVTGRSEQEKDKPLAHTEEYVKAKAKRDELIKDRKRTIQESIGPDGAMNGRDYKRLKPGTFDEERDVDGRIKANPAKAADILREYEAKQDEKAQEEREQVIVLHQKALKTMQQGMANAAAAEYRLRYGEKALQYFQEDTARSQERGITWKQEQAMQQQSQKADIGDTDTIRADTKRMLSQNFWTGRFPDGTGRFEDDYDNRLPRPS